MRAPGHRKQGLWAGGRPLPGGGCPQPWPAGSHGVDESPPGREQVAPWAGPLPGSSAKAKGLGCFCLRMAEARPRRALFSAPQEWAGWGGEALDAGVGEARGMGVPRFSLFAGTTPRRPGEVASRRRTAGEGQRGDSAVGRRGPEVGTVTTGTCAPGERPVLSPGWLSCVWLQGTLPVSHRRPSSRPCPTSPEVPHTHCSLSLPHFL